MRNREAPIGVFDSGIGGLTVVRELRQLLPHENFVYMGDTARVPYGSRPAEEVVEFMHQNLRFFAKQGVKMAVIACNTMTACGYAEAVRTYPFLIVPMNSAVCEAIEVSPRKRIGVIATESTVQRQMHAKAAECIDASAKVYAQACPDFVPLIESGKFLGKEIEKAAERYMAFFKTHTVDSLILGCTHYPLISKVVQKYVGRQVVLINPAKATAEEAMRLLQENELLSMQRSRQFLKLHFSAGMEKARKMTELVLDLDRVEFNCTDLSTYGGKYGF